MVKHANNIKGLLKVNKAAVSSAPSKELVKCRTFLKKYFVTRISNNDLSREEALEELKNMRETINTAANKIAKVIAQMKVQKEYGVPDSELGVEDILCYQAKVMAKLKNVAETMLKTLNEVDHLPMSITAIIGSSTLWVRYPKGNGNIGLRQLKKASFSETLVKLIAELDTHSKQAQKTTKNRVKSKAPLKKAAGESLAQAWEEITGKRKQKLKRNRMTGEPYGEFYNFMHEGLQLFHPMTINAEEAIKRLFE